MYATLKGLAAGIVIVSLAACGDVRSEPLLPAPGTALEAASGKGTLTFTSSADYGAEWPQDARGAPGVIEFTGSLTTPNPCYDLRASHRTSGSRVTLTVSARATGSGGCIQVITHHNYEGAVSRLAAGTYTLEVVHEVGTSRTTVYLGTVTVQ